MVYSLNVHKISLMVDCHLFAIQCFHIHIFADLFDGMQVWTIFGNVEIVL